jgi:hypothetical protein
LIIAKLVSGGYPGIFDCTVGVVFLGTPHRGTKAFLPQSALLAAIAQQSDLGRGIEPRVLDELRSHDGTILDVAGDFAMMCKEGMGGSGIQVTCFFEQRNSNLGKIVGRGDIQQFVVDEKSASIDTYPSYGLPLDHFKLNKFSSPTDGNYKDICGELVRFYHMARGQKARRRASMSSLRPPRQTKGARGKDAASDAESDEDESRRVALEELKREEAEKEQVVRDSLVAEGLEHEKTEAARAKAEAERRYLERLKLNMTKYGIEDPDAILEAYPLPDDKDLKPQEILDKDRWFKNRIKVALQKMGVNETGIVDEIINDTGETMTIDGVTTTVTRMAAKWVSQKTLRKYNVPFVVDPVSTIRRRTRKAGQSRQQKKKKD